jgi:solute carrier family 25 carnitine/acylcarnitine transporter 20/29
MEEKSNSLISLNDFISGSCAGVVQVLVGQPFDMMKVRMQTNPKEYFNLFQTFKKITVEETPLAFYKGTLSPLIGVSFTVAIQFSSNNLARNFFILKNSKKKNPEKISLTQNLLSGLFAGFTNSFVVSPIELIRIKMQVQGNSAEKKYSGTIDCAKKYLKATELKEFFRD